MKVAIIGAGISGLSVAHFLKEKKYDVTVYEKESSPGGLIQCRRVEGSLFHSCGGHVFNSKCEDVLNWFWSIFNQEKEFHKAERNSVVSMETGEMIPYPIEDHVYLFDHETQKSFIRDMLSISQTGGSVSESFEDFLRGRFGDTLYKLYFKPYNEKVWRRDLKQVPLSWLKGKLPMPTVEEIIFNNINHVEEKQFVHSSFYYEKNDGSQFIANKLAEGLNIKYDIEIDCLTYIDGRWMVKGECYDKVVFCGNLKQLPEMIQDNRCIESYLQEISNLEYHGTTAVFCEIDKNPYSWIYQPSRKHDSHRIICTGNFASSNNGATVSVGRITATIEFTDEISKEDIIKNLERIPLHPKYITHQYNRYTYPIQDGNTRNMIKALKTDLSKHNLFFTGRFADWEYYNMDAAIKAAMNTMEAIEKRSK